MDEQPSSGRYRGRRRVPPVPRSRYAAVITSAVVGAGVVALGAGAAVPDAKLDPSNLSAFSGGLDPALMDRSEAVERASRADGQRGGLATSIVQEAPDVYLLPLRDYRFSSPYGMRWGSMHNGIDLAAPHGAPITAIHAGEVVYAGWNGGYGYMVAIDHGEGVQTWYAHASEVLVYVGQEVNAGDVVARVGNTGHSFGAHLHLEVHVYGVPQEPVAWLEERGVDILGQIEEIYGTGS